MIIPVNIKNNEYDIILERGALFSADKYFNLNRKVLIVTDKGVPSNYSEMVAAKCKKAYIVTVEAGESSKSFATYEMLLNKLVELNFTRTDCAVAVGGGVVGDLTGFVASTFMRGIDFYNVPTTVLSQVDSSIGGKVAINLGGIKNVVGAFYQPKCVLIDPNVLDTLSARQISNGLCESVKMAATFDEDLFAMFEKEDILSNIDKIIERSLLIKKMVVEEDEKESGLRKVLNFGHSLGHGIESVFMNSLYHGECVALGMLPMCSEAVRDRLVSVLNRLNLPVFLEYSVEDAVNAIKHDKKMSGDNLNAVLVNNIGSFEFKKLTLDEFKNRIMEANK